MKKLLIFTFLVGVMGYAEAQTTYLTTKWGSLGGVGTSWDTTRIASTTTATRARVLIYNMSTTATDTLFYAFNSRLNDTTATKSAGFLLPGTARSFGVVGVYMVNLKGKTASQARYLEIQTNIP